MRKVLGLLLLSCIALATHAQISSATFGTLEARQLGPGTMSGRISAIEGVNDDNGKTIYVGTAGGGVWKSVNAGASFKPVFDKHCQSIGAIAIDQKHPKTVFVGTGESNMRNSVSIGDGLYKSTDAGDNWTKVGGLDSTEHIAKVIIDPSNSNTIYVAAPGALWSNSSHRGLYKSIDGGKTFEKILYMNDKAGCADVVIDPRNPSIVFATTWEFRRQPYSFSSGGQGSGLWKSTDGGKTWSELSNGLPAKPFGRIALTLSPSEPDKMLAIVESNQTGLFMSNDAGNSWKALSAPMNVVARPFYFSSIVIDPKDSKRVYRPAYAFSYSDDGGFSFASPSADGAVPHADHHALWINPKNTDQLYLGTDGGVYMSLDRGVTWQYLQTLPVGQFYHVAMDKKTPYNVYGGLQDNGSWYAPSSAGNGVKNSDWKELYGGDGFWVTPDPVDPNIAYAESQGGDVNRIDLRNYKSISVRPQAQKQDDKLRWNWNTPIVAGKKNIYVGAQYLYRSKDQGRSWEKISRDLTTNDKNKQQQENSGGLSADVTSAENHCTIFSIAESPLDENLIWVGTDDGNLQVTTDGGKTWTNVSKHYVTAGVPAQTWVSSIEPSVYNKNVVYATFDNHGYGDHKTYVARSSDLGKTWTLLKSDEFTGFAHKIKEDLKNKDLLFLGTEMGLFSSIDGGKNWFRMKNNIPWYALVRDIQIHPITHDLVLATHGRGIMIVDDISSIRELTKEVAEKDVYLFPPPPMALTIGTFGNGGTSAQGAFYAPNAPSIQPFSYYLKDRVSSGDVRIEIYDAAGKLVQYVPGTKRKGVNRLIWNQRMKAPKVASGSKPDYSSFIAPQVMPGNYTIKLKVGNTELSQPLKLYHETSSSFTLVERKKQYDASMVVYRMHEDLAALVDSINVKTMMLTKQLAAATADEMKKQIQQSIEKWETFKGELVPVKQTSMFADVKRLREDISEVYRALCGGENAPSNLQLDNIESLKVKLKEARVKFDQLNK